MKSMPKILVLLTILGVALALLPTPAMAGEEPEKTKSPVAEVVAGLPAPPESRALTLEELPDEVADSLKRIFHADGTEPLYASKATPAQVFQFYSEELGKLGFQGRIQLDEQGKPISPYFTFGSAAGAIRVVAMGEAIPGETVVLVKPLG